jgi:hypothetical protein
MKHLRKSLLSLVLVIPSSLAAVAKMMPISHGCQFVYDLGTVGTAGVSGKATFIENSDATVSIELELLNTLKEDLIPRTFTRIMLLMVEI